MRNKTLVLLQRGATEYHNFHWIAVLTTMLEVGVAKERL
jgi:hypothetical protein